MTIHRYETDDHGTKGESELPESADAADLSDSGSVGALSGPAAGSSDSFHGSMPGIVPAAPPPFGATPSDNSGPDPVMHNTGRSDGGKEQRSGPYGGDHESLPDVTTPMPHGHTGRKY